LATASFSTAVATAAETIAKVLRPQLYCLRYCHERFHRAVRRRIDLHHRRPRRLKCFVVFGRRATSNHRRRRDLDPTPYSWYTSVVRPHSSFFSRQRRMRRKFFTPQTGGYRLDLIENSLPHRRPRLL